MNIIKKREKKSNFSNFYLMLEDPQKFLKSNFSNFLKKKSKVALLDLGKYQNVQSQEVSWVWVQNCRHGAQILGSMGHNGPCPCGIGLILIKQWSADKLGQICSKTDFYTKYWYR